MVIITSMFILMHLKFLCSEKVDRPIQFIFNEKFKHIYLNKQKKSMNFLVLYI